MGFVFYNKNPKGKQVGDCTVRAISKAMGQSWEDTYIALAMMGLILGDMPNANSVWGAYLRSKGFKRTMIPDMCPDCYSVVEFSEDHPRGTYILALSGHVVCVIDGNYYDAWDCGKEIPLFYWERMDE